MWTFWLERSRDAPLDIVLELHINPSEDNDVFEEARHIYRETLRNQHRWRSVRIMNKDMTVDESDGYFISNLTLSSLLEKIRGKLHRTSLRRLATFDISSCHRLEYFALQSSIRVVPTTCEMHRLHILKVKSINRDGLFAILRCSPNLEVLAVTYGTYRGTQVFRTTFMISLPALTDFDVKLQATELDWREWASLFGCLQCPSLVNFRFLLPSSENVCLTLKDFFTRSQPPLKRFSIETMLNDPGDEHVLPLGTAALLDILRILPNLIFLDVNGRLATRPEFVEALAKNRTDGNGLCPLLTQTIELIASPFFHCYKLSNGRETT